MARHWRARSGLVGRTTIFRVRRSRYPIGNYWSCPSSVRSAHWPCVRLCVRERRQCYQRSRQNDTSHFSSSCSGLFSENYPAEPSLLFFYSFTQVCFIGVTPVNSYNSHTRRRQHSGGVPPSPSVRRRDVGDWITTEPLAPFTSRRAFLICLW
jgi:hypothetical protein